MITQRLRVGLLIETHHSYERNLCRGIATYAHAHGPWYFYNLGGMPDDMDDSLEDSAVSRLKKWGAEGLIVRCENYHLVERLRSLGLPMVDLLAWNDHNGIPAVDVDHKAVAQLAADQLVERGFQRFAYCGFDSLYYSKQRAKYFSAYLSSMGYPVDVFDSERNTELTYSMSLERRGPIDVDELEKWICALPLPIGIMACYDIRGQHVLDLCSKNGILVPEEAAVIAVGNDDVPCEMCDPTLSSVEPNTRKMGYEAAKLLHRQFAGESNLPEITLIEPLGVVLRQSTDAFSITDSQITAALYFIRRHAAEGIGVRDVLKQVQLSRSTLERRFMKLVGRSPKEEITRLQIKRVQQLLTRTNYGLDEIARLSGFNYVAYMCKVFKDKTGMTPGKYRKDTLSERGSGDTSQLA